MIVLILPIILVALTAIFTLIACVALTVVSLTALANLTALLQTKDRAEFTTLPRTFHRFMELPVEIRLLVYNELMVHNVNLYRAKCHSCWPREDHYSCKSPKQRANLACAQILRTGKQIYSETIPILYSKNTVHIECLECDNESRPFWFPLLKLHNFQTELIESCPLSK